MPSISRPLDATVAANVRAEVARQRLRQGALAVRLGRAPSWLSRRLSGDVAFRLDELEAIADVLGVPVIDLLGVAA